MPRIPRLVVTDPGQKTAYHIISRTALEGLPFGQADKDKLVSIIQRFSSIYVVDVLGFAVMGNHFHLLVEITPESMVSDDEVKRRFRILYGRDAEFPDGLLSDYRERFCSLSAYVKDIKQCFSVYYNKRKNRKGTLWGERFKSVLVQQGHSLIHCLAYIDLNPLRAGIVKRPEDYRWCSIGYHLQTGNKDNFLSLDLGLEDSRTTDRVARLKDYRKFLYHVGAVEKQGKASLAKHILAKETAHGFEIARVRRFRFKTRYFTDSGIIGSRAFVERTYGLFKDKHQTARDKIPRSVKGIDGMYSLKRLVGA